MFRGFLNEIKNTVISHASSQITGALNNLSGGKGGSWQNPSNMGGFGGKADYSKMKDPFESETVVYPEDLGSNSQGHYVLFNINEQSNASIKFGDPKSNNAAYNHYLKSKAQARKSHAENQRAYAEEFNGGAPMAGASEFDYSDFGTTPQNDTLGKDQMYGSGQSTVGTKRNATRRLKSAIAMYMPASVGVQQSSKYGEVEIGAFTAAGINAYSTIRSGPNMFDNFGGFTTNVANAASSAMEGIKASQGGESFVEKSVRGSLEMIPGLSGLGAAMDIERGFVRNNRMEMIFEGIGRRSFSFSFKMMPKSEQEAKDIDKITRMFRYYMAPSFIGDRSRSRTMIVPSTFDIAYMYQGGRNNFINQISTAVLESCNVTYGGERVQFYRPTTGKFGTGAPPVETQIELQFKELEIITKERINDGY